MANDKKRLSRRDVLFATIGYSPFGLQSTGYVNIDSPFMDKLNRHPHLEGRRIFLIERSFEEGGVFRLYLERIHIVVCSIFTAEHSCE